MEAYHLIYRHKYSFSRQTATVDTVIRCVITDKSGATGDDTHTVSVINRDPSVTIFGASVGLVSQGIDLEARATDPDGFC